MFRCGDFVTDGYWGLVDSEWRERTNVAGIPRLATQRMRERSSYRFQLQVPISLRHSYLGQLWQIADILPTNCRQRNGTRRDGRYVKGASGLSGRDTARYNMTVWDSLHRTFNQGVALSRTVWAATGIPREQTTPVIGVWTFRGIARTNIKKMTQSWSRTSPNRL